MTVEPSDWDECLCGHLRDEHSGDRCRQQAWGFPCSCPAFVVRHRADTTTYQRDDQ